MYSRAKNRRIIVPAVIAALGACVMLSCEGSASHVDGPRGASAFSHYVVLGTGLSMGMQSGGVVYESQVQAWPALLAHAAGVGFTFVITDTIISGANSFAIPFFRVPGCQPPLIAPLQLGVDLAGASVATADTTCAGLLDFGTPPQNNLAIAGASAYAAMNLTPKIVLNATLPFSAVDRARYPLVLASTQSQVTALRVEGASLVSLEFGLTEVLAAATSGRLVPATSYTQTAAYTYVPADVFAPVFSAIADSVKLTGAKVVLLSVPKVSGLYALRPASELWTDRAELATYGITVNADCSTSGNFIFTPSRVPALAAAYASTGIVQNLSCTDAPGTADAVLTPADLSTLDGVVTQMNTQIQQVAQTNGWAFADLTGQYPPPASVRYAYSVSDELTCASPYGRFTSLDGVFPNVNGQSAIAATVASALNAKYGFTLSVQNPISSLGLAANPCR